MATSGAEGRGSDDRDREALRREIAAGKRPATPFPGQADNHDPDGQFSLLDEALAWLSAKRQVRQRLFADLNFDIPTSELQQDLRNATDGLQQPTFQTPTAGIQSGYGATHGHQQAPMPSMGFQPSSQSASGGIHPGSAAQTQPPPTMPSLSFQDILNGPVFSLTQTGNTFPAHYFQAGRTFLKMFQRPVKDFMALPRGFGDTIREELLPAVQLMGDTSLPYLVEVHDVGGRLYFTNGWERFVLAERIQPDDLGLFIVTGPRRISMRLYYRNGLEKPFSARAVDVDPDLPPPAAANVHVPSHILGIEFELGPKMSMTSAIMQQMANVWATRKCNNPLYVCRIIPSHIRKSALYFGTKFSALLPPSYRLPAAVFFGDGQDVIRGAITKTSRDDLARLSTGFGTLVRMHGIAVGDIVVVRVREVEGGYRVRVFKVPA